MTGQHNRVPRYFITVTGEAIDNGTRTSPIPLTITEKGVFVHSLDSIVRTIIFAVNNDCEVSIFRE